MAIVTPESFAKDLREGFAFMNKLNEDTDPGKPLQTIVENCLKAIDSLMFKVSIGMETIATEIMEVNQGRPVNEQWLNEKVDIEAANKEIEERLSRAEMYLKRAGSSVTLKSGETIDFHELQIKSTCLKNDDYVMSSNRYINEFIEGNVWLKPSNHPQYTTQSFREKYLKLIETVTSLYTLCVGLLNKYYDIKKLPNKTMENIPATRNVCGKLLMENATGATDTKPPFITESMFNTGK